jgi:mannose-1-phosphate guanylyltransferase
MRKEDSICVVMAGGSGERFWPLSRRLRPKQLLKLAGGNKNLLQETVARIAPLISAERILIATSRELQGPIRQAGVGVPDDNVVAEPCKRNTAGCLAYVAAHVLARFGAAAEYMTMAVLSADQLIRDRARFLDTVEVALAAVERQDALAVIGIRPTRPETGYGYVEIPEEMKPVSVSPSGVAVYPVARFREKPNAETAAGFIATGRFFWNSGMFFWRLRTFLNELEAASPAHARSVAAMAETIREGRHDETDRVFESLENISIDYALMEKARHVLVIRADFDWDDIGAWDALDRTHDRDEYGNVAVGQPVLVDTRDSIVYNEAGPDKMAVAVVGVENLAVIVREDGVLVIPKDRAQEVRKAVAVLKERNARQL